MADTAELTPSKLITDYFFKTSRTTKEFSESDIYLANTVSSSPKLLAVKRACEPKMPVVTLKINGKLHQPVPPVSPPKVRAKDAQITRHVSPPKVKAEEVQTVTPVSPRKVKPGETEIVTAVSPGKVKGGETEIVTAVSPGKVKGGETETVTAVSPEKVKDGETETVTPVSSLKVKTEECQTLPPVSPCKEAHVLPRLSLEVGTSETHPELIPTPKTEPPIIEQSKKKPQPQRKAQRKQRNKKAETEASQSRPSSGTSRLLTDYFPVRRSGRTCESKIKERKDEHFKQCIINKCEDGLKVVDIPGKGRGVCTCRRFDTGDFVVEYAGELVELKTAQQREECYSKNTHVGCYMYYFDHKGKKYCVDATEESGRLGRLINHSKLKANCQTKVVDMADVPSLILVASRSIAPDEELLYDYGDRSPASLEAHPWLRT